MKIVDKQRDYYDCSMGLSYDPSVLYVRSDKKKIKCEKQYGVENNFGILGFCGKLYPFFYTNRYFEPKYYWNIDQWIATEPHKDRPIHFFTRSDKTDKNLFENVQLGRSHTYLLDNFHIYNVPIFLFCSDINSYTDNNTYIFTNPLLRPLNFVSIKDPYTAFQEIYQYVGGVLNNQMKPIPTLDDETMAEIKGFDKKWSFRKEPRS